MATIHTLIGRSELIQLGGGLEDWERPVREMYAFPHVIRWLDEKLPLLKPALSDGMQTPLEQTDNLLHDFIVGEDFDIYQKAHFMRPKSAGVWELKTTDVRIFGWFYQRGIFIATNIESAYFCKLHDLYHGLCTDVERRRSALDLDEPKYMLGEYQDVL